MEEDMFILAQSATDGGQAANWLQMLGMWWPVVAIVVVMYFLLIRPQRTKEKRRQEMLKSLEKNDRVVTIGGIHGVVRNVTESEVTVLVDEKHDLTLRFNRSAVYSILRGEEGGEIPPKEEK
jgi:preprotein translocase subunit YajC